MLHEVLDTGLQLGFHGQVVPLMDQLLKFHDHSGGTPDSTVNAYLSSPSSSSSFLKYESIQLLRVCFLVRIFDGVEIFASLIQQSEGVP